MKYSSNFFFCLIVLLSIKSFAFRLEPMEADFAVEGDNSTKIFRVENEGKEKIAVKIQAFTRNINTDGKETMKETSDFKIYPDQISLAASDSRAVRVVYVGKKEIEKEQAYRIVASQLPIAFKEEKKKAGINFLFQFIASVYVTSDKYQPKVQVESISPSDKDHLKVKLINKGQKHILLKDIQVKLKDQNGVDFVLNKNTIENWDGENLLSGSRRIFKIKSKKSFDIQKNAPIIESSVEN